MELINLSPFAAERLILLDHRAAETLVVVVKATYGFGAGRPRVLDDQEPVRLVDEFHGEPGLSSVKAAGEGAPFKPAADVLLLGHARAPGPERPQVDVRLRVGPIDKTVRVMGERRWRKALGLFARPGPPEPFERMPLTWERAFGGSDDSAGEPAQVEPRNPVGVGFRAEGSRRPPAEAPLPNLEDPAAPIRRPGDRPAPAGFGPICPHWSPRLERAGTYDEAWAAVRAPLLPDDFDPTFHQVAPPGQVYPGYIEAGTPIELENATPSGRASFPVPATRIDVRVKTADETLALPMRLDTLTLDGDAERLLLVWRGSLSIHNQVYGVEWIRVASEGEPG